VIDRRKNSRLLHCRDAGWITAVGVASRGPASLVAFSQSSIGDICATLDLSEMGVGPKDAGTPQTAPCQAESSS
jgi:hypothetical protein